LPNMAREAIAAGQLTFDPMSITFLAIPSANNQACR
jgi:heparanase 1